MILGETSGSLRGLVCGAARAFVSFAPAGAGKLVQPNKTSNSANKKVDFILAHNHFRPRNRTSENSPAIHRWERVALIEASPRKRTTELTIGLSPVSRACD